MPITQVGAMTFSTVNEFSAGPTTINRPTGVVQGDLVVVVFKSQTGQAGDPTMGDGFTRLILSTPTAVFYKLTGASEPSSWSISHSADYRGAAAVAFRGVSLLSPVDASAYTASAGTFPGVTSTRSGVQLALATKNAGDFVPIMGYPAGYTGAGSGQAGGILLAAAFVARAIGTHPGGNFTDAGSGFGASVFLADANVAPNAPTLAYPTGNVTIDRNLLLRFTWNFSDPDPGDTQSKYDIQYRLVGAAPWTGPFTGVTAFSFHDSGPGTFAAGAWEWQIRTYDSLGAVGPYSASAFFTAGSPPAGPTVTAPVNGSTLSTASTTLVWSSPTQDAYQVRKVADAAGVADTATVYFDTGTVEQASVRSHPLTFPVNTQYEHLQVRVRTSGLWSAWASTRVLVSFTPPASPTLTVTPVSSTGSLNVAIVQPPITTNLVTNSSFEVNTTGWTTTGANLNGNGTLTRSTVRAFSGSASGRFEATTTAVGYNGVRHDAPVTAGTTYTVSAYVYLETLGGSDMVLTLLTWFNSAGASLAAVTAGAAGRTAVLGAWVRLTQTGVAPAGAVSVACQVRNETAGLTIFHVDAAQFETGSTATTYTGGATPAALSADLWRRESSTGNGIRVAAGLLPAATYIDRTVASGQVYEYRAVSFAANGASATSAWTP